MGSSRRRSVERVDPFQRRKLDLNSFHLLPWSSPMDDLGLEDAVDRLGERII